MQKIIINHLGPIKHCELNINDFIICTGSQAAGKSTLAKSVFFFKNLRNILYSQFMKQYLLSMEDNDDVLALSIENRFYREMRSNFLQIFGTTWHMDRAMSLEYYYAENTFIKMSLKSNMDIPNYIWIECSKDIQDFLGRLDALQKEQHEYTEELAVQIMHEIELIFCEDAAVVYIPAGRSMITLLSSQLNYIYSFMNDTQKRNLDYCTQSYLERILRLKQSFTQNPDAMIKDAIMLTDTKLDINLLHEMTSLMRDILQGEYLYKDGEERLQVTKDQYVKVNFASSGQQEVVWILNVLFYYLLNNRKAYFIIEEPESHLFPQAQKLVTEFISLARGNGRNQIFITTHSPYILGTINNLLYADRISESVSPKKVAAIIPQSRWLDFNIISAYFINKGIVASCLDKEFHSIENEVIDGVSDVINEDYDKMVLLKEESK